MKILRIQKELTRVFKSREIFFFQFAYIPVLWGCVCVCIIIRDPVPARQLALCSRWQILSGPSLRDTIAAPLSVAPDLATSPAKTKLTIKILTGKTKHYSLDIMVLLNDKRNLFLLFQFSSRSGAQEMLMFDRLFGSNISRL